LVDLANYLGFFTFFMLQNIKIEKNIWRLKFFLFTLHPVLENHAALRGKEYCISNIFNKNFRET